MCAGAVRSHDEHAVAPEENTSTARGNSVDVQLRGHDSHSGGSVFESVVECSIESRHISTGSSHVETNDRSAVFRIVGCSRMSNDTAGWTRQDSS